MNTHRCVVATTNVKQDGTVFTEAALRNLADSMYKRYVPILDNFDNREVVGYADNPSVHDGLFSVELHINRDIEGYSVIGYSMPDREMMSIGIVERPMDRLTTYYEGGD